ncbi:catechol 1,2-dioxygenase [Nocardia sp. NPDC059246]|uniref:DODA-type extradiol aromatic ring-opening family dioxygenase n=1 Tax=unclassified Nocardia TaxID=2637762 RepID=UPI0036B4A0C4
MSKVVIGIGASHATMANTYLDKTKDQVLAQRYMSGIREAHRRIGEARPDAVIVVGSNHFQGFFLDLMPAFTICLAEVTGKGDGGTPTGPFNVDFELGRSLAWGLQERDFDIALSLRQEVDHGIAQMVQFFTPDQHVPIVPLVVNTFTPPLPGLRRCWALGAAIRDIVENDGADRRIAVIASGGLSHTLPFIPKWYEELGEDEQMIVDALYRGAPQEDYHKQRVEIMKNAQPIVNAEWDEQFLRSIETGDFEAVLALTNEELEDLAGNGGQEIRSWLVAAAAAGGAGSKISYSPLTEWFTGMGVAAMGEAASR